MIFKFIEKSVLRTYYPLYIITSFVVLRTENITVSLWTSGKNIGSFSHKSPYKIIPVYPKKQPREVFYKERYS